jgi:DNA-binding transcriptional LysR family regulator
MGAAPMQHLVAFVHAAEHGSFSAAARILGMTAEGVSKNVARLEAELGVRLFHRSTLSPASWRRSRRVADRTVPCRPCLVLSDPEAIAQAVQLGLGVALLPMPFAFSLIRSGELVRLLPGWYSDAGPLSLYYPSGRLLPAKTRVFVEFVVDRFRTAGFAALVDGR